MTQVTEVRTADTPVAETSAGASVGHVEPGRLQDAHDASLLAVQQALAANWTEDLPEVVLFEIEGITTVHVSTLATLKPAVRADVRGAVRAALAPFSRLAPYTRVVFLTRGRA